ncbi:MAG TPA: response regulator transcription factor [Microthrixaceae bacterium]|nr:response regulator transcription factor [Microthrixaceae bacterium]
MDHLQLPISVASVNDYEVIVEGVGSMLRKHPDRLLVRDRIVIGEDLDGPVDVALYDTYGRVGIAETALRALAADPLVGKVAVFSLDVRAELIKAATNAGAAGFISKALSGDEIARAVVRIAGGEYVEALGADRGLEDCSALSELEWPGRQDGLSERESQVLVLCAEGLTNGEIADALFVGLETVKSHLRSVYSKLDIRNRVAAAAYAQRSGAFARYQPADPTGPTGPTGPMPPPETQPPSLVP